MAVEALDERNARSRCVQSLGLDADLFDLSSREAAAAALRRAASLLCPTSPRRLISTVEKTFHGLVEGVDVLRVQLTETLDAMVGYGDLLELARMRDFADAATQLFLAPPSFVRRRSGTFLLVGIRPEAVPLVGEGLTPFIELARHIRRIRTRAGIDVERLLREYGLRELPADVWLSTPRKMPADDMVRYFDSLLDAAGPSGQIEGLTILDPTASVLFYKGRWHEASSRYSGRFVARRPQAYGADIWCYAELSRGVTSRVLDLPPPNRSLERGCDAAWRLQAAIDAVGGHPPVVRVARGAAENDAVVIDVFSPVPSWLQRRWDSVGTQISRRGALVSYSVPREEATEEIEFAAGMLWCRALEEGKDPD